MIGQMGFIGRMGFVHDVLTVLWKEWKELPLNASDRGLMKGPLSVLLIVAVLGVVLPLQEGRAWVDSPIALLVWGWAPILLVSNVVAQAFAGERERHTLETLLATRLSDQAILLGKVAASALYGWSITVVSLLLGLITVNVAHRGGGLLLYAPVTWLGAGVLVPLIALLASNVGVLVSLRAGTVRQAQQALGIVSMVIVFGLGYGLQALPQALRVAIASLVTGSAGLVVVVVAAALAIANVLVLLVAMSRFQRTRLILD
jgi:ABC-2 type transport system permease protein